MNRDDFNVFVTEMRDSFPDFDAWILGLDPLDKNRPKQSRLLQAWRSALSDVELSEARDVIGKMLRGDLPPIKAFERDQTPAIVRNHVREAKRLRSAPSESERYREPPRRHQPRGKAGEHFSALDKLLSSGVALAEASRQVFAGLGATENESYLRRFNCHICEDSAWVVVWNERAMLLTIGGGSPGDGHEFRMSVPCSCEKGGRLRDSSRFRYSDRKYCLVSETDAVDALRMWIHARQQEKRHREFDLWNQRAETEP